MADKPVRNRSALWVTLEFDIDLTAEKRISAAKNRDSFWPQSARVLGLHRVYRDNRL